MVLGPQDFKYVFQRHFLMPYDESTSPLVGPYHCMTIPSFTSFYLHFASPPGLGQPIPKPRFHPSLSEKETLSPNLLMRYLSSLSFLFLSVKIPFHLLLTAHLSSMSEEGMSSLLDIVNSLSDIINLLPSEYFSIQFLCLQSLLHASHHCLISKSSPLTQNLPKPFLSLIHDS